MQCVPATRRLNRPLRRQAAARVSRVCMLRNRPAPHCKTKQCSNGRRRCTSSSAVAPLFGTRFGHGLAVSHIIVIELMRLCPGGPAVAGGGEGARSIEARDNTSGSADRVTCGQHRQSLAPPLRQPARCSNASPRTDCCTDWCCLLRPARSTVCLATKPAAVPKKCGLPFAWLASLPKKK